MLLNSKKQISYIQAKTIIIKSRKLIKIASSNIVYYVTKNTTERNRRHRTEQRIKCLRARRGPLLVNLLATANELGRRKTQLKCYKDILLTGNRYKII